MLSRRAGTIPFLVIAVSLLMNTHDYGQKKAPVTTAKPKASAAANRLFEPTLAKLKAPPVFRVKLVTTKGDIIVQVNREWAPNGADRFYNLVKIGYFKDIAFFRVIQGFMAQFGIHGNPEVSLVWRQSQIPDDPVKHTNKRGTISFATSGPNSRTTQLFINYSDRNVALDSSGFSPIGEVVEGMGIADSLHNAYGEGAPRGTGPNQQLIQTQGNAYLQRKYPLLDYIRTATIEELTPPS